MLNVYHQDYVVCHLFFLIFFISNVYIKFIEKMRSLAALHLVVPKCTILDTSVCYLVTNEGFDEALFSTS